MYLQQRHVVRVRMSNQSTIILAVTFQPTIPIVVTDMDLCEGSGQLQFGLNM